MKAGSLKREGVVLTAFTLALLVPFAMGRAERWFGVVCVLAYAAFVWRVIVDERRQTQLDLPLPEDDEEEEEEDAPGWAMRLVERIPIPPLG